MVAQRKNVPRQKPGRARGARLARAAGPFGPEVSLQLGFQLGRAYSSERGAYGSERSQWSASGPEGPTPRWDVGGRSSACARGASTGQSAAKTDRARFSRARRYITARRVDRARRCAIEKWRCERSVRLGHMVKFEKGIRKNRRGHSTRKSASWP